MWRPLLQVGALALVGATTWGVLAMMCFRYPQTEPQSDTDAYYVLASPGGSDALNRFEDWLPKGKPLLVSTTPDLMLLPIYQQACNNTSARIICVEPDPSTTQGEARNLGRISREHGWQSVTVITHRSHITRSRLLMSRCFYGDVRMLMHGVERGKRVWLRALAYESGAMLKAGVTPRC